MTEWGVFGVIVSILTFVTTLLVLLDRNKKPIDKLGRDFAAFEVQLATLNTTLQTVNETLIRFIDDDNEMHKELRSDIRDINNKVQNHEVRISTLETQVHNS